MISRHIRANLFNITKKVHFSTDNHSHIKTTPILEPNSIAKKRNSLGLRRQKLPPYPSIETIINLDVKNFVPSNFREVAYGDYKFQECLEGFVQVYATGYYPRRDRTALAGYSVYYGSNHQLNSNGPVVGRQDEAHCKLYAVYKALESMPKNAFNKVCICVDQIWVPPFLSDHLCEMSENAFRSTYTGKLNPDLETNMAINQLLRTRQDLTFRLKYTPTRIGLAEMAFAKKSAIEASKAAEERRRLESKKLFK